MWHGLGGGRGVHGVTSWVYRWLYHTSRRYIEQYDINCKLLHKHDVKISLAGHILPVDINLRPCSLSSLP